MLYSQYEKHTIFLEQNEAVLKDTRIGFLEAEAESEYFLSIEYTENFPISPLKKDSWWTDPAFLITLSNNKNYYERKAYTLLDVLGDFGGFNDAIVFLIHSFMGVYSAKMFAA